MSALLALASRTHEAVSFRHCESQLSLDPSSAAQLSHCHGISCVPPAQQTPGALSRL